MTHQQESTVIWYY